MSSRIGRAFHSYNVIEQNEASVRRDIGGWTVFTKEHVGYGKTVYEAVVDLEQKIAGSQSR